MGQCIVCNKPTENPKFCGRSCAATYNNQRSPKRKPEGKCDTCGSPIVSSRKRCQVCRENAAAQAKASQVRRERNLHSWQTLSGEHRECPVARIHVNAQFIFSVHQHSGHSLQISDSIGKLLDQVVAVCFERPTYLTPIDAKRHIVLLDELRSFECTVYTRPPNKEVLRADTLPIEDIDIVLDQWVESYFRDSRSRLLPSYALDTARFIQKHAFGHYDSTPESWHISALLKDPIPSRYHSFPDSRLKKDISEHLGKLKVIATTPAGANLIHDRTQAKLPEKTSFLFQIERCHLSSGWYDHVDFTVIDPSIRFNVSADFRFIGTPFIFSDGANGLHAPSIVDFTDPSRPELGEIWRGWKTIYPVAEVPANWITHTVSNDASITAAPNWIAEIS